MKLTRAWIITLLLTLLLAALCLLTGPVAIPPREVFAILFGGSTGDAALDFIVMESRLPQMQTAWLAGSALAVTGLMLQTAFRNPLAGPGVFGVNSGASVGVALVMLLFGRHISLAGWDFGGFAAVLAGAMAGSMGVMAIILAISRVVKNNVMLLIAGIMTGYIASSSITLLNFFSSQEGLQAFTVWGMGTFSDVSLERLPLMATGILAGLAGSFLLIKPLNALLLGENYARSMGINPLRVRNGLLLVTGWLTAVVTAYCGPIGFIGLAVPHVARMAMKTDNHLVIMPFTMLFGGITGLLCAFLCNLPGNLGALPLGAVTPLLGAPVIIYVILKQK